MPLVATPQPLNAPPRVRLDATGLTGASVTVMRLDPDGRRRPVRAAEPVVLTGGAWSGYDYEAPFGSAVSYQAGSARSDSVTLAAEEPWLIHPGIPERSLRIAGASPARQGPVFTAGTMASRLAPSSRALAWASGRRTPIVVSDDAGRRAASSALLVRTYNLDDLAALDALLADDVPLLLNVPAGRGWGVAWEYVSVGDVTQARSTSWASDPTRVWSVPYDVVERPAGGVQAQWTVADVSATYATADDLLVTYATVTDLLTDTRMVVVV